MRKLAVVAVVLLIAACAHDGRTLSTPPSGATSPPLPETTVKGQRPSIAPIALTSTAFAAGGSIPIEHTCDGAGVSPPLAWGSVPEGTVELAITVTDPDANGFVHWVLANLDPSVQALAIGGVPDGAVQAKNGAGTAGWIAPCPPPGAGPHHYVFTLYALTSPTGVTEDMSGTEAIDTISKVAGLTATLIGVYQRA